MSTKFCDADCLSMWQVGIVVIDSVISDIAFGGPAHNCGAQKGDRIVSIDGSQTSTAEEIESALMINDYPGAVVKLKVVRTSDPHDPEHEGELVLTKMDTSLIADRCQIFSLFAALKVLHWSESGKASCVPNRKALSSGSSRPAKRFEHNCYAG